MNTVEVSLREGDDFIKLGQLLKKAGIAASGSDARFMIEEGLIQVNGETDLRRGRKVRSGDLVSGEDWSVKVL